MYNKKKVDSHCSPLCVLALRFKSLRAWLGRAVVALLFLFSCAVQAKYKVCSITINSPDEIEIFQQNMDPRHFEFVELVPLSVESRPNNVHWFTKACDEGHQCDILVISGHFGGLFFGETHNYILPVDMMERRACSRTCQGLLSNVKEVFLFGCNTLADKRMDQRSPEEYLQVLLDHQMARDMAEIVVSARYLPFGLSFKDQMQMVFSPTTVVYGFTSLSPLGRYIRQPLNNYFHQIREYYGSYKAYLDQRQPEYQNPLIYPTIGGTVAEVKGLGPDNSQFRKMCRLYQNKVSSPTGMQVVKELMDSGGGPKAYLAIKDFMYRRQPFTGESLSVFNDIKNNPTLKREFYVLYDQISESLPYVKIQFLNFLNVFGWVKGDFYDRQLKSNTLKMVRVPTSEAYDFATALVYDEKIPLQRLNLSARDFDPYSFYKNIWSALILDVLEVRDYVAHRRLMNTCLSQINTNRVVCYQVLKTLGHLRVNDLPIIERMESFLDMPDPGLVYYAMYGLAYSGVQKSSVHQAIARHCDNPDGWLRKQSIRSLGHLQSRDAVANSRLVQCIESAEDEETIYEGLNALYNMFPAVEDIRQVILDKKLHEHPDPQIRNLSLQF